MSLNSNHQSLYFFFLLAPSPPRQAVITFMTFYGTLKKKISIRVPFISFICVHIKKSRSFISSLTSHIVMWTIFSNSTICYRNCWWGFLCGISFLKNEKYIWENSDSKCFYFSVLGVKKITESLLSRNNSLCWRSCN